MKQTRPILHGRDHAQGGADPIPGLNGGGALEWEDVGTSGASAVWAAADCRGPFAVTPGVLTLLPLQRTSQQNVTVGATAWTIQTAGLYEIHAAGTADVRGPSGLGTFATVYLTRNGSINQAPADYVASARLPGSMTRTDDIWWAPLALLSQVRLAVGATVAFTAAANSVAPQPSQVSFDNFAFLLRRLGS